MIKTVLKGMTISLAAALLLTGCSSSQETVSTPTTSKATASSATAHDTHSKKRKKRFILKKAEVDLDKFCFKDNRSIHYKSEERCQ